MPASSSPASALRVVFSTVLLPCTVVMPTRSRWRAANRIATASSCPGSQSIRIFVLALIVSVLRAFLLQDTWNAGTPQRAPAPLTKSGSGLSFALQHSEWHGWARRGRQRGHRTSTPSPGACACSWSTKIPRVLRYGIRAARRRCQIVATVAPRRGLVARVRTVARHHHRRRTAALSMRSAAPAAADRDVRRHSGFRPY